VLLARRPIEPISHPIRAWVPLTKAQRIEEVTYESPALPLSYSAAATKLIERDPERQARSLEHITIEQHITFGHVDARRKAKACQALGRNHFIDSLD
jgi:hypothetical protein